MIEHPPALRAALDQLSTAESALDSRVRLQFSMEILKTLISDTTPEQVKPLWAAVKEIVNSGSTPARLDHLTDALRVGDPDTQMAFAMIAGEAIEGDEPRAAIWAALRDVVWAIGEPEVNP